MAWSFEQREQARIIAVSFFPSKHCPHRRVDEQQGDEEKAQGAPLSLSAVSRGTCLLSPTCLRSSPRPPRRTLDLSTMHIRDLKSVHYQATCLRSGLLVVRCSRRLVIPLWLPWQSDNLPTSSVSLDCNGQAEISAITAFEPACVHCVIVYPFRGICPPTAYGR